MGGRKIYINRGGREVYRNGAEIDVDIWDRGREGRDRERGRDRYRDRKRERNIRREREREREIERWCEGAREKRCDT